MRDALHTEVHGRAGANRCVLLHGFTQTGRCWTPTTGELAPDHEVVTVDLPGHGGSGHVRGDLWRTAALAADAGAGTWVGYSMGARVALHVALARPDVVERLVLVSGTAGLRDAGERAARRDADSELAARIERIGVPAFLDEWLALPMFSRVAPARSCRSERLRNHAAGHAASLRSSGSGTQEPLWERLPELATTPVLVVTGAHDERFTALGAEIAAAVGSSASHVVMAQCGHTPPLEDPPAFGSLLRAWLAASSPASG